MNEEKKKKVMGKINEIKSNIETFISDVNVTELKASFNTLVKDAQKDFNRIVEEDLSNVRKKLQQEKTDFETKAKKFLDGHKKELEALQSKVDKLLKASKLGKKKAAQTTTKKAPSKKAIKKKVSKATKKAGFKPKA